MSSSRALFEDLPVVLQLTSQESKPRTSTSKDSTLDASRLKSQSKQRSEGRTFGVLEGHVEERPRQETELLVEAMRNGTAGTVTGSLG